MLQLYLGATVEKQGRLCIPRSRWDLKMEREAQGLVGPDSGASFA